MIYGAPFFDYSIPQKLTLDRILSIAAIKGVGDEVPLNPIMQGQWVCHDPHYWKKMNVIDGTAMPIISGGVAWTMMEAIGDVNTFAHRHTLPTLILTGGKDKIVDNAGAREFFKNIKTPADKKVIKLFYNGYHQLHKEPQYKF